MKKIISAMMAACMAFSGIAVSGITANAQTKNSSVTVKLGAGETVYVSGNKISNVHNRNSRLYSVRYNSSKKMVQITAHTTGSGYFVSNGKTYNVNVYQSPKKVSVSKKTLTLSIGQKYTISESTSNGYANAQNIKWTSNGNSVASVKKSNANKAIIYANKAGTAKISVRIYNGKTDTCTVKVKKGANTFVNSAKKEVGNKGWKYCKAMGFNKTYNWCAIFVGYMLKKHDSSLVGATGYSPNVGNWQRAANKKGLYKGKSYSPKPGDIVIFKSGNSNNCHMGIVVKAQNRKLYTIEGNVSGTNVNNTKVNSRVYDINNSRIQGYITSNKYL